MFPSLYNAFCRACGVFVVDGCMGRGGRVCGSICSVSRQSVGGVSVMYARNRHLCVSCSSSIVGWNILQTCS